MNKARTMSAHIIFLSTLLATLFTLCIGFQEIQGTITKALWTVLLTGSTTYFLFSLKYIFWEYGYLMRRVIFEVKFLVSVLIPTILFTMLLVSVELLGRDVQLPSLIVGVGVVVLYFLFYKLSNAGQFEKLFAVLLIGRTLEDENALRKEKAAYHEVGHIVFDCLDVAVEKAMARIGRFALKVGDKLQYQYTGTKTEGISGMSGVTDTYFLPNSRNPYIQNMACLAGFEAEKFFLKEQYVDASISDFIRWRNSVDEVLAWFEKKGIHSPNEYSDIRQQQLGLINDFFSNNRDLIESIVSEIRQREMISHKEVREHLTKAKLPKQLKLYIALGK